ncbi:MAG: helix-turn-helix transcriptional regulator [Nitrospiraceae bacterium]
MTTPIGSNLRAIRGRLGLTQEQLADNAEVHVDTVRGIENGQVDKPFAGTIYRLSKALGVTVHDLTTTPPEQAEKATPPSEGA